MKYFTLNLWIGADLSRWPLDEYRQHLERLRGRIPPWFLEPTFSPHDSRLRRFQFHTHDRVLELELDDASRADLNPSDAVNPTFVEGRAKVTFVDVATIESWADPAVGLGGPFGYGDWGYEEIDVTDTGLLELSVLFSSGIELRIVSRDIQFCWLG